MNRDHLKGAVENAVGIAKEAIGELFGNEKLAIEGRLDQARGAAHDAAGYTKDAASEATKRYHRYLNRY
jgi:uncharacterized protein YjbJ (UPF0337 family)